MARPMAQSRDVLSFGPFRLVANERCLERDGARVELGARALDTLIALTSRPNEVISKKDLLAIVWPDVTVEEASLRFHIASLRKALGDGKDGARYISTLAGRGYCFVAPVSRSGDRPNVDTAIVGSFRHANLPSRLTRMVGRDEDVLRLSAHLTATRFVTIVGAGGVGKTTVAVAVGHHLVEAFAGAVLFVDLGMLSDSGLVPTAVASLLGLSVQSDDAAPGLIAYLRDKQLLLILDTCEHLIDAAARLASQILLAAPQVHILTTSREVLQVEGEHVYRLGTLACPPDGSVVTAAIARTFPAPHLFLERAVASGARLDLCDAEVAIVVSICRKLDGMALAIELAARHVHAYGLQQTAAFLDQRLTLLWLGPRTATPRQRTLQATLDWSYQLLSELERIVLRRLAVFVGHFTLDAALAVVTGGVIDQSVVFGAIDSLVAKSMIATRPIGAMMRYRLLDTTRAYVLEISVNARELTNLAVRHARYYQRWLEQSGTEWSTLSPGTERTPHFAGLNNVRAALEWCFDARGDNAVGVGLAVAAAPVFFTMSLIPECHRWSERAILALNDATRGGSEEMHLQATLGISSIYLHGGNEAARVALSRSLAIAEERGDAAHQARMLGLLHLFHLRGGDYETALTYARRGRAIVGVTENTDAIASSHSIWGWSLHLVGDLSGARTDLETSLRHWRNPRRTGTIYDRHYHPGVTLARTLWLQGHPAQAVERAHEVISDARHLMHPASLTAALAFTASVFFWIGDLRTAEAQIDASISHAESDPFGWRVVVGRCRKAELSIRLGDPREGVESLRASLEQLSTMRYAMLTTEFYISLIQGLASIGCGTEALALVDETIRRVNPNGAIIFMAELLRVKGSVLLAMPQRNTDDAEACFMQSLQWSRRQGARAWELRTAIDLAGLLARQGRPAPARALLQPVLAQFTEGLDTADLRAAERMLESLAPSGPKGSGGNVTAKQETRPTQPKAGRRESDCCG